MEKKEITNEDLAQLIDTDAWKIIKYLLKDTADRRYSWDRENLEQSRAVQEFVDLIIRKIDGSIDGRPESGKDYSGQ